MTPMLQLTIASCRRMWIERVTAVFRQRGWQYHPVSKFFTDREREDNLSFKTEAPILPTTPEGQHPEMIQKFEYYLNPNKSHFVEVRLPPDK